MIKKRLKARKKVVLLLIFVIIMPAVAAIPTKRIDVVVFHADTCGACRMMADFLDDISQEYPTMVVKVYDVKTEEGKKVYDLFKEVYELDISKYPVPIVFIGKDYFRGFSHLTTKMMEEKLKGCYRRGCTIGITQEQDLIIIMDSTPTPQMSVARILIPFVIAAGVFSCLNPYTAEIVPQVKTWKSSLFFAAYFATSFLLCSALFNIIYLLDAYVYLRLPFVALAVLLGVLSVISVKVNLLRVPASFRNSMDQLIYDHSGLSLFSLGIGTCLLSLIYTCGMYLLVIYKMLFYSLTDRLMHFALFNVGLTLFLLVFYVKKPEKNNVFFITVGIGSCIIGILYWMVW